MQFAWGFHGATVSLSLSTHLCRYLESAVLQLPVICIRVMNLAIEGIPQEPSSFLKTCIWDALNAFE